MLLSVIISTYNRSEFLSKTLQSLLEQKKEGNFDFDVVIVDNNSSDNTKNVVTSFIPAFNNRLRYLFEPQQGKSYALNKGIAETAGDILVFTDDDVVLDPHWLSNIVECFETYRCDGLGGRILPQYPPDVPEWLIKNKDLIVGPVVYYNYGEGTMVYEKPMYEFLGANFAFKRSLFNECGLFRTDIGPGKKVLGEDTEITNRFLDAGKRLYYCGKVLVWHPVEPQRMTLKYISEWYIALGRYRVIMNSKNSVFPGAATFCGIPLPLLKRIAGETMYLLTHVFNQRELLRAWVDLCVSYGKASQLRRIREAQKKP